MLPGWASPQFMTCFATTKLLFAQLGRLIYQRGPASTFVTPGKISVRGPGYEQGQDCGNSHTASQLHKLYLDIHRSTDALINHAKWKCTLYETTLVTAKHHPLLFNFSSQTYVSMISHHLRNFTAGSPTHSKNKMAFKLTHISKRPTRFHGLIWG